MPIGTQVFRVKIILGVSLSLRTHEKKNRGTSGSCGRILNKPCLKEEALTVTAQA